MWDEFYQLNPETAGCGKAKDSKPDGIRLQLAE